MSILQDNLSENPCYGVASDGTGYLEFSCVYGVEKYYGRYNMDVLFTRGQFASVSLEPYCFSNLDNALAHSLATQF